MWWQSDVQPVSVTAIREATERQQQLTKPLGALGRLEDLAIQLAGFQNKTQPTLKHLVIVVFAGDHGVVAEGVSVFPQAVTVEMIRNFIHCGAAISVLARQHEAEFSVVNMGTAQPLSTDMGAAIDINLAPGTQNFCEEAAMSETLLHAALDAGREQAPEQADLFIAGEMGIGNTSSATAIACALLDMPAKKVVGRGTGLNDADLGRKTRVIERALSLHSNHFNDPLAVLRCFGGFEIVAMVGAYIACAQRGIPSLVDGFISTSAALVACRLNPNVRQWLLFSHRSAERGHRLLLDALDAKPLLDLDMRLGEGSGAAVAYPLLQQACWLHEQMATFAEAGVSDGE